KPQPEVPRMSALWQTRNFEVKADASATVFGGIDLPAHILLEARHVGYEKWIKTALDERALNAEVHGESLAVDLHAISEVAGGVTAVLQALARQLDETLTHALRVEVRHAYARGL